MRGLCCLLSHLQGRALGCLGPPPTEEVLEDMTVGTIAMWSLLNGPIPTGWAECNGTANAPGPDLRDRFVVGRSPTRTADTTGGSSTHTHTSHPWMAHLGVTVVDHAAQPHVVDAGILDFEAPTYNRGYAPHPQLVHEVTQPIIHADQPHNSPNHEPPFYVLIYIQRMS